MTKSQGYMVLAILCFILEELHTANKHESAWLWTIGGYVFAFCVGRELAKESKP